MHRTERDTIRWMIILTNDHRRDRIVANQRDYNANVFSTSFSFIQKKRALKRYRCTINFIIGFGHVDSQLRVHSSIAFCWLMLTKCYTLGFFGLDHFAEGPAWINAKNSRFDCDAKITQRGQLRSTDAFVSFWNRSRWSVFGNVRNAFVEIFCASLVACRSMIGRLIAWFLCHSSLKGKAPKISIFIFCFRSSYDIRNAYAKRSADSHRLSLGYLYI